MMKKRNGEYKESQITTINNLWFYLSYEKLYFARKHSSKKVVYTITSYLQFFCVAGYLKRSNDTPKLIWICISV